ncbi:hypothetical protein BLOT_014712 [Blomia tropicalis]|nr:hypothetical protein BLOT_014712 [Blomia tropicalis]
MDSFVSTSFYHDTHDNVWHMLIILNPSSTTTRASDILLILSLVFICFGKLFSQFIHLNQNQESKYSITNNSGFEDKNCEPIILSWMILASMTKTVDQLSYLGSFWYVSLITFDPSLIY